MTMNRRDFVRASTAAAAAVTLGPGESAALPAPAVHTRRQATPRVISDVSGIRYTNEGPESQVERAFRLMTEGEDVLEALISGVNIPELDPTETGIGYGGLPNADGVVQLDACCMHGPRRWAGGVASLEGVKMPSRVAQAVMEHTDHHLLVGPGATRFARQMGFEIVDDLNTDRSRELWLEWRRRVDPGHWLDPEERLRGGGERGEDTDPDVVGRADAWYRAGLEMVEEGLIPAESFWGTTNCNGVNAAGEVCGVTTTSGLAWKIPGRVGDSPILGAGLYVDNDVGAAGSTGRGEANLYNLSSFLIVENMRRGLAPKDAGMAALERIRETTVEPRLLNDRGLPAFDVRFFVLDASGDYAGVALYGSSESMFAVCDENGAREEPLEGLLEGSPSD
jgi:N4-(beta-N-acetylglucosaminyl)-L-asparaginase